MPRPSASAALAALASLVVLAGCTTAEPEPTRTIGSPAPSASAPAPDPEPVSGGWTAPAACTSIAIAPGATLTGAALGACVEEALSSFGSGRMLLTGDQLAGTIAFTYSPRFSFAGELESGDGPVELTFVDETMWVDYGDGPIRGDATSAVTDEQMAGIAGELYRVFSDPAFAGDLIASSPSWTVDTAPARHTLPTGEVDAYRIVSAAPFAWYDIPVQEYVLWVAPDWTPVAAQSTSDVLSARATVTQDFYDLGEPITVTAPN